MSLNAALASEADPATLEPVAIEKVKRVQLPRPHAAQLEVLAHAKRFNVLACGRRWGKSQLGINLISETALGSFPTAWFAPVYKSLAESWRELLATLQPVIANKLETEHWIKLITGGTISMWSLDTEVGENVRGRKFKRVILDEAAMVKGLKNTWESAIMPTLADYQGDAWMCSTPRGLNDFSRFYDRGQDPLSKSWASWRMPTSTNPYIKASEIEEQRQNMAAITFSQEYLAEFISTEGAIFRNILEAVADPPEWMTHPGRRDPISTVAPPVFAMGIDWGRTGDYTVLSVAADLILQPDQNTLDRREFDLNPPAAEHATAIVAIDRFRGVDYATQRGRVRSLWERFGRPFVLAEANSIGQPNIEQLRADGIPVVAFVTQNQTKAQIIDALALSFEQGLIAIPNFQPLITELQSFEATPLPSGLMRYSAPEGGNDDCVISVALSHWALRKYGGHMALDPYQMAKRQAFAAQVLGGAFAGM